MTPVQLLRAAQVAARRLCRASALVVLRQAQWSAAWDGPGRARAYARWRRAKRLRRDRYDRWEAASRAASRAGFGPAVLDLAGAIPRRTDRLTALYLDRAKVASDAVLIGADQAPAWSFTGGPA